MIHKAFKNVAKRKFVCPMHSEDKQTKNWSLEQRKVYCRAMQGDQCLMPHKPRLPKGFQQSTFKGKSEREVVSCCKLLGVGILCSCSCAGQVRMFL